MRDRFNKTCISGQSLQRAALFYSLNRLGYNGMCRYNSERIYSVPWGKHTELKLDLNKIDYLHFVFQVLKRSPLVLRRLSRNR